jgi:hypothetical protein
MAPQPDRRNRARGAPGAVKAGARKSEARGSIALPKRSDVVTLVCPSGEQIPARIAERGIDTLLVLIVFAADPLGADQLAGVVLEFPSIHGLVRLGGTVVAEDRDLIRFSDLYSIEVQQQRDYVRVKANRPVLVYFGHDRQPIESYAVDLAGGGLLLAGPDVLEIGEDIEFQLTLVSGSEPIEGTGTVVRSDVHGRRAISFNEMSEPNRRRLVRFIFDCERAERRRMLEADERNGN